MHTVGFFAPSGFLPDPGVMDRAAQFFSRRGWRVSAGDSVFSREQRFAGPDSLRAEELQRFATDRSLDIAIAARGGYGLTRLLDRFDYAAIAAAGLPLVGYSDFTAFNLALLARAGGISFQGPSAADFAADFNHDPEPDPFARANAGNRDARFTTEHFFRALSQETCEIEFAPGGDGFGHPARKTDAVDVRGRLWGGNLAMVCSLLGTPYFPRVRGGILFLEDVNEPAYRIERMLLQLLHAGVLPRQKAVLLGDFTALPTFANDNGFDLAVAIDAIGARCDVPLVGGLPFGHGRRRVTLAVGAQGHLLVDGGAACLRYRGHPTIGRR